MNFQELKYYLTLTELNYYLTLTGPFIWKKKCLHPRIFFVSHLFELRNQNIKYISTVNPAIKIYLPGLQSTLMFALCPQTPQVKVTVTSHDPFIECVLRKSKVLIKHVFFKSVRTENDFSEWIIKKCYKKM